MDEAINDFGTETSGSDGLWDIPQVKKKSGNVGIDLIHEALRVNDMRGRGREGGTSMTSSSVYWHRFFKGSQVELGQSASLSHTMPCVW